MLYSCSCSKFWASRSRQCWRLHASADDLDDGDHNDQYEDDSDGVPDKHDQYDRDERGKYKIDKPNTHDAFSHWRIPDICHEPHEHIRVKFFCPV